MIDYCTAVETVLPAQKKRQQQRPAILARPGKYSAVQDAVRKDSRTAALSWAAATVAKTNVFPLCRSTSLCSLFLRAIGYGPPAAVYCPSHVRSAAATYVGRGLRWDLLPPNGADVVAAG